MKIGGLAKKILPRKVYSLLYDHYHPMIPNRTDKERRTGIASLYKKKMGADLDLSNPQLFTEKLQWYKLYYCHPDMGRIVCKYNFKQYIKEKLGDGYTVPIIGAWTKVEDIPWDTFPKRFVLKSNCQSDGNFIKIIKDKDSVDFDQLKEELEVWLNPRKTLVNSFCKAYWNVTPMILAEEYIEQIDGQVYDYKIFCFDGKPYCAYVATEHFSGDDFKSYPISFYDLNWNRMDVRYGEHALCDVERPEKFDEMLRIAGKLSEGFPFVRVDFFDVGEKLYVSELTFYPGGGTTPYHPESFDREMGEMFHLPMEQKQQRKS